jgi:hypothetical protein
MNPPALDRSVPLHRARLTLAPAVGRLLACLLLAVMAGSASGCARVAPHQRGRLAHPSMLLTDFSSAAESHIYAIQEGAVGGGSGAEGGCGCN